MYDAWLVAIYENQVSLTNLDRDPDDPYDPADDPPFSVYNAITLHP